MASYKEFCELYPSLANLDHSKISIVVSVLTSEVQQLHTTGRYVDSNFVLSPIDSNHEDFLSLLYVVDKQAYVESTTVKATQCLHIPTFSYVKYTIPFEYYDAVMETVARIQAIRTRTAMVAENEGKEYKDPGTVVSLDFIYNETMKKHTAEALLTENVAKFFLISDPLESIEIVAAKKQKIRLELLQEIQNKERMLEQIKTGELQKEVEEDLAILKAHDERIDDIIDEEENLPFLKRKVAKLLLRLEAIQKAQAMIKSSYDGLVAKLDNAET